MGKKSRRGTAPRNVSFQESFGPRATKCGMELWEVAPSHLRGCPFFLIALKIRVLHLGGKKNRMAHRSTSDLTGGQMWCRYNQCTSYRLCLLFLFLFRFMNSHNEPKEAKHKHITILKKLRK